MIQLCHVYSKQQLILTYCNIPWLCEPQCEWRRLIIEFHIMHYMITKDHIATYTILFLSLKWPNSYTMFTRARLPGLAQISLDQFEKGWYSHELRLAR